MRFITIFLLIISANSLAKVDVHEFKSPEQEALYREMVEDLRCLVCQGQNLAGSGSDWAKDVRDVVYEQVSAGADKQQIVDYMVQRFGNSVLYDPPLKSSTMFLWTAPFVLLIIGLFVMFRIIRSRNNPAEQGLTEEQKAKAKDLLK